MASSVLIVGAGLGGCLTATYLAELGYRVSVYEQRDDPRRTPGHPGRAINLALSAGTFELLQSVGLGPGLRVISVPLQGRVFHLPNGKAVFTPYESTTKEPSFLTPSKGGHSVPREQLNLLLLRRAEAAPHVQFHFKHKVVDCRPYESLLEMTGPAGRKHRIRGDAVIAADGAFSAIRARLVDVGQLQEQKWDLRYEYAGLSIPAASNGRTVMRKRALHVWAREGCMVAALPNADNTFTGGLFFPSSHDVSGLHTVSFVRSILKNRFSDMLELTSAYPLDSTRYGMKKPLVSVRCRPWHIGHTVLLGDACHTLYPFSGWGANLAFEDCIALKNAVASLGPAWEEVFARYEKERKAFTDGISEATRIASSLLLSWLPTPGMVISHK